jgi:uncharacterized protein (DUF111 family)
MLIMVNVDCINGEIVPYVIESLLERGAANVHVVQAITKKGRPEFLFFIDAAEDKIEALGDFLAAELGTLGLRIFETRHLRFTYEVTQARLVVRGVESWETAIGLKIKRDGQGCITSIRAEYEDLKRAVEEINRLGLKMPFSQLRQLIEAAAREKCAEGIEVILGNGSEIG